MALVNLRALLGFEPQASMVTLQLPQEAYRQASYNPTGLREVGLSHRTSQKL